MKMTTAIRLSAALAFLFSAAGASAEPCRNIVHEVQGYTVCEASGDEDLRLFLKASDGSPIGTFDRLRDRLSEDGQVLGFAMNAGMYHPDRRPVGLYVENGQEEARLITAEGPGNFGLTPNGVFCIAEDAFRVIETKAFAEAGPDCLYATQSGPMLVIEGALHPRFLEDSDSRYIRNGVGVSADGDHAYFVISDGAVNFHSFARVFRDVLGTPDALYFDGNISRLYAPSLGRDDLGFPMGPIVGLVGPAD